MRTVTKKIKLFTYDELSERAKDIAKSDLLDIRNDTFYMDDDETLYPYNLHGCDLRVIYDFSCSQGSGVNIIGKFYLVNFIDLYPCSDAVEKYLWDIAKDIAHVNLYDFEYNNRYTYSCKFFDRQYMADDVLNVIASYIEVDQVLEYVIKDLIEWLLDYLESVEREILEYGRAYLVEGDGIEDDAHEYEFTENGHIY